MLDYLRQLSTIYLAILGNSETTMIHKQSMVILVNYYKDNYNITSTTANKSMAFDPSAIQSCFFLSSSMISEFVTSNAVL